MIAYRSKCYPNPPCSICETRKNVSVGSPDFPDDDFDPCKQMQLYCDFNFDPGFFFLCLDTECHKWFVHQLRFGVYIRDEDERQFACPIFFGITLHGRPFDFKFGNNGTAIRVKRSNGDLEDGWNAHKPFNYAGEKIFSKTPEGHRFAIKVSKDKFPHGQLEKIITIQDFNHVNDFKITVYLPVERIRELRQVSQNQELSDEEKIFLEAVEHADFVKTYNAANLMTKFVEMHYEKKRIE
jgi:hypothetical protein